MYGIELLYDNTYFNWPARTWSPSQAFKLELELTVLAECRIYRREWAYLPPIHLRNPSAANWNRPPVWLLPRRTALHKLPNKTESSSGTNKFEAMEPEPYNQFPKGGRTDNSLLRTSGI